MDSAQAAFQRFSQWKKDATRLNLTMDNPDGTENSRWRGQLFSVHEAEKTVGFMVENTRDVMPLIDLEDADFLVMAELVEITRPDGRRLVFEVA